MTWHRRAASIFVLAFILTPCGPVTAQKKGGGGSVLDDPAITMLRSTDLYVMDADGTGATRILRGVASAARPVWSPDGRQIAFGSGRGVYVVNRDGSGLRRVVATSMALPEVAWSPVAAADGRYKLAYTDVPPGRRAGDVFLIHVDGTGLRQLTDTPGVEEFSLCWAPTATRLCVTTMDVDWLEGCRIDVLTLGLDAQGGVTVAARSTLRTDPTLQTWFESPAWSPGNVLAFTVRSLTTGAGTIETLAVDAPLDRRLLGAGVRPSWEPAGTLVFSDAGYVRRMNADGSGRATLALGVYPDRRRF